MDSIDISSKSDSILSAQWRRKRIPTIFIVFIIVTKAGDLLHSVVVHVDINVDGGDVQRRHQKSFHVENRQRGRLSTELKSGDFLSTQAKKNTT